MEDRSALDLRLLVVMVLTAAATFGLLAWWSYRSGETERWPLAAALTKGIKPTPQPTAPQETKGQSFSGARVVITGLHRTEEGEEVVLTNQGGATQALSGWRVCQGQGKCFTFPEGSLLEPGSSVRLWSGKAKPKEMLAGFHWSEQAMWPEADAQAVLRDASGEIASRFQD